MGSPYDSIWIRFVGVIWIFLYLPPSQSAHLRNMDVIAWLDSKLLENINEPIILLGDLNAHVFPPVNPRGVRLLNVMAAHNLICLNNDANATYFHSGASTIIDYAWVSSHLLSCTAFAVGAIVPESLHCPIHIRFAPTSPIKVSSDSAFPFHRPLLPLIPTSADRLMGKLLAMVDSSRVKPVHRLEVSPVRDTLSMSTIRRRLRGLGKRQLSPGTSEEIASLKQDWRLLSNRSLLLRRKLLQKEMWEMRGRKSYWSFINQSRKKKSGVPLAAKHIEAHFDRLLSSSVEHVPDEYAPDPLFSSLGLPPVQPSMPPVHTFINEDKADDIIGGIDCESLLSTPITSAEISYALVKLPNSAIGEDSVRINELRTVPS